MNNEHEQLSPNERALVEKEIPGRKFLEKNPKLAMSEKKKITDEQGRLTKELIFDDKENLIWEKNVSYEDNARQDTNTNINNIKAISERTYARNNEGFITEIEGTNLDREHSWTEQYKYDEEKNLTSISGEVTEGKRKGENWKTTFNLEKDRDYTKETKTTTGKHFKDGQLVNFITIEINYLDNSGNSVYGYHKTNGKKTMEWGNKPEDIK